MIDRIRFAHLPTPIEDLPRLSEALKGPHLLVKRDDTTGLAFGGNKTRKLEFLVAEAQAAGARTLITAGAARFGFTCILVLVGEEPPRSSANLLLDQLFGAEIVWTEKSQREILLQAVFEKTLKAGRKPYLVPYGGSNPTGALGYTFAMEELMGQLNPGNLNSSIRYPDWVIFASSSGGTQAGMILGARVFGYTGKVLGISVDEPQQDLQQRVAKLAAETSERLGPRIEFTPDDILVNADYAAPGYGVFTDVEEQAISLFAKYEGLLLDPVYTGRAAAGMIDLVRKGFFREDEVVLFWHTGGQPALFAEKYQGDLAQTYLTRKDRS
jgi:1-aminocyclopropane-1-carboxylate deaminase/D-cysteine desulfhydrase-like pyridoxal-dependent ACC family enzyme